MLNHYHLEGKERKQLGRKKLLVYQICLTHPWSQKEVEVEKGFVENVIFINFEVPLLKKQL